MSAVEEFLAYERGIEKDAAAPSLSGLIGGIRGMLTRPAAAEIAQRGADLAVAAPKQGFGEMLKQTMRGTAAVGLAGAATGAALGTAEKLWDLASNTISKVHGFQTMMQANPELDKMDRQKVHTVYSTLHRFNPEMARDPFVSGAWVKKLTEYDYVDPKTVGDLISARSKSTGDSFFQRGVQLAQQGAQFGALDAAKVYAQEQAKRQVGAAYQESDLASEAMRSGAQQLGKDFQASLTAPSPQDQAEAVRQQAMQQAQGRGMYEESPEALARAQAMEQAKAMGRGQYGATPEAQDASFRDAFNQAAGRGAYEKQNP